MAHYTLIARIKTGDGNFPFVNVQFSKNHRPIPIEGATYYLRRSGGIRTPLKIGKDLSAAHAALLNMECDRVQNDLPRPVRSFLNVPRSRNRGFRSICCLGYYLPFWACPK
jgi:hypothetical protein